MSNKTVSNKPSLLASKHISAGRLMLFKGISIILIPLLLSLFAELILRVIDYGDNYSLFTAYGNNDDYLVFNPNASKKYFTKPELATRGNSEIFKKKKATNTVRIFILGESTTIGYPYFHNGSFHRWLQFRLLHTYPGKNFEVINLSLTAVNSFTVLGFAKDVVNYDPDAVLVYTGHNEYYGALGAASTQSLGSNPRIVNFIIGLRGLRLSQLILNVYNRLNGQHDGPGSAQSEGRMQMMVAKQRVPLNGDLYRKGVTQFSYNMDLLMKVFSSHHIPLFVSNLVSNEKDLKPFISSEPDNNTLVFQRNLSLGINACDHKNFEPAALYFQKAERQFQSSALCNYYIGKIAYEQGDLERSKKYYTLAKNLDELRFRAPDVFNKIIARLVNKYPGVYLVDNESAFEMANGHDISGDKLFVDHVHPNLRGYAIMSDAFYESIKSHRVLPAVGAKDMTFERLVRDMPHNEIDSAAGVYRVLNLKSKWPYLLPHALDTVRFKKMEDTLAYNLVFKNSKWEDVMHGLYTNYIRNKQLVKARDVLINLSLEYPADAALYEQIAMLSGALRDDDSTLFYLKKSFDLLPGFEKSRYLFVNYLKNDIPSEALVYIDYAIANNTSGLDLLPVKNYTERIIRLQSQYAHDGKNIAVLLEIANLYRQMGNTDAVLKYAKKILKTDAGNQGALALLPNKGSKP